MTVTLSHPSTGYTPGDTPCPTCGRYGGTPGLAHGGEYGGPDTSLAGLRCTAEYLRRMVDAYEGGEPLSDEALPVAAFLADTLAGLDRQAGGVE